MAMTLIFLYLIGLYVRPQDWVPAFLGLPTATIIIPLAMIGAVSNYMGSRESFQLPQNRLLVFYLFVIFISTFLETGVTNGFDQFVIFLKRIVVFYMVAWTLITPTRIHVTIWAVLLLSVFLAYQAYLQGTEGASWGGLTPYPGYTEIRVRWFGDWDGPNVFGILFVMSAAMALEFVFGPYSLMRRLLGIGLVSAFLTAIYFTNSRGAVLALACATLFYFRDRFRRHPLGLALAALALVGLFTFGPSRMSELNSGESSAHERTWLWEQGLTMLRENPVFGVGRGEFMHRVDLKLIAHNNYVQNFAETGLVGFSLFIAILWFCFRGCYLVAKPDSGSSPAMTSAARMAMSAIVGFAAATFFVVMELDLLYFVLGLSAAVYLVARRENPNLPALSFTRFDRMVIGGGVVGLIVLIWLAAVMQIL